MRPIEIMRNGYLFRRIQVKFDPVGQRYKMCTRKFWIDLYSRRANSQYGISYQDLNIFISCETPIVKTVAKFGEASVVKKLEDNWTDIFDYAISKAEIGWITYSESDKSGYELCEKEEAIKILDITPQEFEKIRRLSPYS